MLEFRYSLNGTWYKGNTHLHSTRSDGGKTIGQLAQMYADAGYDFLFRADHWVPSDVRNEDGDPPLLWLDGVELDGTDESGSFYHVVCLGTFSELIREQRWATTLQQVRALGGITILAHPHWTGNSFDDALRYGFDGVEVYNHVCRWLNGKGDGAVHWSAMLDQKPNTLAFACDDAHIVPSHPGWNGGWIMVNAPACSREAIIAAIRAGNYYSSCGPQFLDISLEGDRVSIETSPVQFARLVGPAYHGMRMGSFDGQLASHASFTIPQEWPYAYLEIEDDRGRRAWTNPLFVA